MGHKHVELRKASRIEQPLEPLPRRQLAGVMLPAHPLRTAHARDALFALAEIVDAIGHDSHSTQTETRKRGNAETRPSMAPRFTPGNGYAALSCSAVSAIPRFRQFILSAGSPPAAAGSRESRA